MYLICCYYCWRGFALTNTGSPVNKRTDGQGQLWSAAGLGDRGPSPGEPSHRETAVGHDLSRGLPDARVRQHRSLTMAFPPADRDRHSR